MPHLAHRNCATDGGSSPAARSARPPGPRPLQDKTPARRARARSLGKTAGAQAPRAEHLRVGATDVRRAWSWDSGGAVTPKQALAFVEKHGVVLQAARGPVPSFAEHVAGEPIRGSWWGHARGHEIFKLATAVCESGDVLVCRLVDGKVTYVHRRLWPALVKLAARFDQDRLAQIDEEHTASGAHRTVTTPFPQWVPADVRRAADSLSVAEAEKALTAVLTPTKVKPGSPKPR
jgi:hypothetical protein